MSIVNWCRHGNNNEISVCNLFRIIGKTQLRSHRKLFPADFARGINRVSKRSDLWLGQIVSNRGEVATKLNRKWQPNIT